MSLNCRSKNCIHYLREFMILKTIKYIFYSVSLGIFCIVLMEIGLRMAFASRFTQNRMTESHPFLFYKLKPNLDNSKHWEHKYSTNSQGLRGKEFSGKKPLNTFRIIVLGGSAAFGIGASSDEASLCSQLEKILNGANTGREIEVINAACIGYTSSQELIMYQFIMCEYEPDLVIVFDGFNDSAFPITTGSAGYPEFYYKYKYVYDNLGTMSQGLKIALNASAIKKLLNIRMTLEPRRIFTVRDSMKTQEFRQGIMNEYERNMEDLFYLTDRRGIPFILFLQPFIGTMEKRLSQEEEIFFTRWDRESPDRNPYIVENFHNLKKSQENLNNKLGIPVYDLYSVFSDYAEQIFVDECHVNDAGQKIEAEFIAENIISHNFIENNIEESEYDK